MASGRGDQSLARVPSARPVTDSSPAPAADAAAPGSAADRLVEELFAAEGASLVRLASIYCDDRESAEDLVQEAFIRLHRNAGSIGDPERAPAYLRSIVINLARDHNRRGLMSLRHTARLRREAQASLLDEDTSRVFEDETLRALRMLSSRQRDCLTLRFYLDLPEREIADVLGISTNSVKTHTKRGLAAMESMLERGAHR